MTKTTDKITTHIQIQDTILDKLYTVKHDGILPLNIDDPIKYQGVYFKIDYKILDLDDSTLTFLAKR